MKTLNKFIDYKILKDFNLIIEYYSGHIDGNDGIELIKKIKKDINYNPSFNVLVDFRDIDINWTDEIDESLSNFIQFMKTNSDFISIQLSVLISKPMHAVLSELLKSEYANFSIKQEIFSTLESALFFLNIQKKHTPVVIEEINKFRKKLIIDEF